MGSHILALLTRNCTPFFCVGQDVHGWCRWIEEPGSGVEETTPYPKNDCEWRPAPSITLQHWMCLNICDLLHLPPRKEGNVFEMYLQALKTQMGLQSFNRVGMVFNCLTSSMVAKMWPIKTRICVTYVEFGEFIWHHLGCSCKIMASEKDIFLYT